MSDIACPTCSSCPTKCSKCSSYSVCTECKTPYFLHQSDCLDSCPSTTFTSTNTCQGCPTNCDECSSSSVCTECTSPNILYQSGCLDSCPAGTFFSSNTCQDCPSHCSSCTSLEQCQTCDQGYVISNSLCVLSPSSFSSSPSSSQQAQEKATQAISSSAKGIGSVVCVGSATAPVAALVSKTVQNTRYLNLSVTSDLAEIYQTWDTDLISWDVPNVFSNADHFESSPSLFARYDLGSPFLVNFWPTLLNIGIGFTTFIVCIVLQKLFERAEYEGWASSLVQRLIAGSFNFALVQAYACLDDILFYLVLDLKTNPFSGFFSWASVIAAFIFLVTGCLLVFWNFWTVRKYQNIKNQGGPAKSNMKELEAFNERNKYWELFYSDFSDDDIWSQSFFAILMIRSTLSSLIISVLSDYPLMQTSYLIILDGAIIMFLYFKTPFARLQSKLAQYYYEGITLLVHICTFILSFQDTFKSPSEKLRNIICPCILYLNTALIGGSLGFMFIEIFMTIREKTKAQKRKQRQSIPEESQETQNLTQTASPLQPPRSEAHKRQYWIDREQPASVDNFYFVPGMNQNGNITNYDLNMESFQAQGSNFNAENSFVSEMNPSYRINQQRIQNVMPRIIRHKPLTINQRQQRSRSTNISHARNARQFEDA